MPYWLPCRELWEFGKTSQASKIFNWKQRRKKVGELDSFAEVHSIFPFPQFCCRSRYLWVSDNSSLSFLVLWPWAAPLPASLPTTWLPWSSFQNTNRMLLLKSSLQLLFHFSWTKPGGSSSFHRSLHPAPAKSTANWQYRGPENHYIDLYSFTQQTFLMELLDTRLWRFSSSKRKKTKIHTLMELTSYRGRQTNPINK